MGIWTLGLPKFCEPLEGNVDVTTSLFEVFSSSDEWSALKELAPDSYAYELDRYIAELEEILKNKSLEAWDILWEEELS